MLDWKIVVAAITDVTISMPRAYPSPTISLAVYADVVSLLLVLLVYGISVFLP